MNAYALLLICLLLGLITARFFKPPIGLAPGLNWWVINIALPALILSLVSALEFHWDLWFLVASQWLVFVVSWFVVAHLGRLLRWPRARIGCVVLLSAVGNTAFLGYPMLEALLGPSSLSLAAVGDQLGVFVSVAIGGVVVASIYAGTSTKGSDIAYQVISFPPFIALVIALIAKATFTWPEPVAQSLHRIGLTLTPIALFTVGMRLKFSIARDQGQPMFIALGYKLIVAPLMVLGFSILLGIHGMVMSVAVLQAAMAPMVSAAIIADQHRLDPPLANAILGIGILLSFVTVPLWNVIAL